MSEKGPIFETGDDSQQKDETKISRRTLFKTIALGGAAALAVGIHSMREKSSSTKTIKTELKSEEVEKKILEYRDYFKNMYGIEIKDGAAITQDDGTEIEITGGKITLFELLNAMEIAKKELLKYPPEFINNWANITSLRFIKDLVVMPLHYDQKPDPGKPQSYALSQAMRYDIAFAFRKNGEGKIKLQYNNTADQGNRDEISKTMSEKLHQMILELAIMKDFSLEGISEDSIRQKQRAAISELSLLMSGRWENKLLPEETQKIKDDLSKWTQGKLDEKFWQDLQVGKVNENYWTTPTQ